MRLADRLVVELGRVVMAWKREGVVVCGVR